LLGLGVPLGVFEPLCLAIGPSRDHVRATCSLQDVGKYRLRIHGIFYVD
jgi:hypothetical protein